MILPILQQAIFDKPKGSVKGLTIRQDIPMSEAFLRRHKAALAAIDRGQLNLYELDQIDDTSHEYWLLAKETYRDFTEALNLLDAHSETGDADWDYWHEEAVLGQEAARELGGGPATT